jgi:hypothetical protein
MGREGAKYWLHIVRPSPSAIGASAPNVGAYGVHSKVMRAITIRECGDTDKFL